MPIKDRSLYPPNWDELSTQIKTESGWKCENCGVANHAIGYRDGKGFFNEIHEGLQEDSFAQAASDLGYNIIKIVLTTAHLDQNPQNNDRANLKALCQKCHLDHDRPFNLKKAEKTRRIKKYGNHKNQIELPIQQSLTPN